MDNFSTATLAQKALIIFTMCCITIHVCKAQEKGQVAGMLDYLSLYGGFFDEKATPNYLYPLSIADSILLRMEGAVNENSAAKTVAMFYSFVGENRKSLEYAARGIDTVKRYSAEKVPLKGYETKSAIEDIIENAYKYDIIFLDDASHRPEHRVFALQVLEELKNQGFTKVVFDDIRSNASVINLTKMPDENLGGLMNEPNYAHLIREAFRLDLEIIPNKSATVQYMAIQDSVDAMGIFDAMGEDMSKIFIYCKTTRMDMDRQSVAHYLEMLTGKPVLRINQTRYNEESNEKYEDPTYTQAVSLHSDKEPFTLKLKNSDSSMTDDSEIFVFHPRTNYESGRASWLKSYGFLNNRFHVDVPLSRETSFPESTIIQVYHKNEFEVGIPIDQFLSNGFVGDKVRVYVPYGEFVIIAEDVNRDRYLEVAFTHSAEGGVEVNK